MRRNRQHEAEFEQGCMEHLDSLYATAMKLTRNRTEADELVQDTYLRAFRFRSSFAPGTNLRAWLFRILTNTFINDYRRARHARNYVERAAAEPLYDEVLNRHALEYAGNPENHVFNACFQKELTAALEELPEEFRMAVLLCDVQGFSYKEIAEMLELPMGTVMSRLHRGRRLLQARLVDWAVEEGIRPAPSIPPACEDAAQSEPPVPLDDFRRKKEIRG